MLKAFGVTLSADDNPDISTMPKFTTQQLVWWPNHVIAKQSTGIRILNARIVQVQSCKNFITMKALWQQTYPSIVAALMSCASLIYNVDQDQTVGRTTRHIADPLENHCFLSIMLVNQLNWNVMMTNSNISMQTNGVQNVKQQNVVGTPSNKAMMRGLMKTKDLHSLQIFLIKAGAGDSGTFFSHIFVMYIICSNIRNDHTLVMGRDTRRRRWQRSASKILEDRNKGVAICHDVRGLGGDRDNNAAMKKITGMSLNQFTCTNSVQNLPATNMSGVGSSPDVVHVIFTARWIYSHQTTTFIVRTLCQDDICMNGNCGRT